MTSACESWELINWVISKWFFQTGIWNGILFIIHQKRSMKEAQPLDFNVTLLPNIVYIVILRNICQ